MYGDMYDEQYEREYAWESSMAEDGPDGRDFSGDEDDDEDCDDDYIGDPEDEDNVQFADPGGNSSLRAGPRTERCPTCKFPNRLTVEDVRLGYQCDTCANAQERGIDAPYNDAYDEEDGDDAC